MFEIPLAAGAPFAAGKAILTVSPPPGVVSNQIDPDWASRRDVARRKEYIAGCLAYLGLTWEGNGLLLATGIGIIGAWLVVRSLYSA